LRAVEVDAKQGSKITDADVVVALEPGANGNRANDAADSITLEAFVSDDVERVLGASVGTVGWTMRRIMRRALRRAMRKALWKALRRALRPLVRRVLVVL
jgi:hypothetical protein